MLENSLKTKSMVMSKKVVHIVLFLLIVLVITIASIDEEIFKINKSFEILGEVYWNINENYVDEIDPEELFNAAINGMLAVLDPYSEYYNENSENDLEFLKSGEYIGFGMTVDVKQGKLTITNLFDGYPAANSGLRIGDRIFQIDTAIIIDKPASIIREFSNGKIGEKIKVKVIRDGIKDTLDFWLNRMIINLPDVRLAHIIEDTIGYIKIDRFTKQTSITFKNELRTLYNSGKIKSLIIDLRDNPGGLMNEAIEICGLFVPAKTMIVKTKNRFGEIYQYQTLSNPLYPELPLIILINNQSASAAEIIAGALQDLDRAVVIGEKSFGKGLVQSIISLPYNASLKLTTSKYYFPSGRCIQKIQYGKKIEQESNIFYTKNGRPVKESSGITPDTIVLKQQEDLIIQDLKLNDCFFNFANTWSSKYKNLPEDFQNDTKVFDDFMNFLKATKYFDNTTIITKITEIEEISSINKFDTEVRSDLSKIKNKLKQNQELKLINKKDNILIEIRNEILKRFYSNDEYTRYSLNYDEYIKLAKTIIQKSNYKKILKFH